MSEVLEIREVPFTQVSIKSILSILLNADLFVKYRSPEKAFSLLRESMERSRVQSRRARRCGKFANHLKNSFKRSEFQL
jgi:hypothetical protein